MRRPVMLIHGLNCGGWVWRFVSPLLVARGFDVIAPTLTGTGDRAHLLSHEITLETHIQDIVATIDMLDLRDIVLVGHSYGGMVATCVADRLGERIARLIYLDALIAQDGKTAFDILPAGMATSRRERAHTRGADVAFPVPPESALPIPDTERRRWFVSHLRPHPVGTYETPVRLSHPPGEGLPVTYIAYENPALASIEPSRAYARSRSDWHYRSEAVPHDAEVVYPEKVAAFIAESV
ncbi:alpha/beta fold hydrolase [Swaminathania salitolerans]|nr:alpha/beta fold hydrolase [Swaminathania salitolerans]GBQ09817.1 alpha/beta hydrolase [Swaminathania salitolerans LMG 21291]